ncbi:MAG: bifunctional 5,10-methylenetetrahydrofolate dehydrogenase/5,10-methenyltetrahydrofolate cyclohydrolase [Tissierellaceae bacterium]|nr:bifunctional 5,10-methylenetetrahydrofolate dehydrogenase/5,10-methenyltetrahydrofolate cyclohydrolase [Tissierellaceae bacterium]
MRLLKGSEVAKVIKQQISDDVKELNTIGKFPRLGIIRLGNDPSDISYEKSIIKNCDTLKIDTTVIELYRDINTDELVNTIKDLNNHNSISGILIFRPLPKHIDEKKISMAITPSKDVDCMHPLNLEKIFEGDNTGFAPCTPKAAMEILSHNKISLEGKNVIVINRTMVVGKPLSMMLLKENATVTICHSRTKNLQEITRNADIVMTALGKANFLDDSYFNEDSIVIDIGVSLNDQGMIAGDVDSDKVKDKIAMITPVPGGVGSVTTSILLKQVVDACKIELNL